MIDEFIKTCVDNGDKIAFISGKMKKTYRQLLSDIYKTVGLFEDKGLSRGEKVLLLLPPSYDFYVLIFACIYYGINVVVADDYKDLGYLRSIAEKNDVKKAFSNKLTGLLRFAFKKGTEFIDVSAYKRYRAIKKMPLFDKGSIVLTTFTSGTTGDPKPIYRSVDSLSGQIAAISDNIDVSGAETVFCSLPIYVLFVVFKGITCLIGKKVDKRYIENNAADTVIAPIDGLLKARGAFPSVKKVFCGGARLYKRQAERLVATFNNASIRYTYGASECAMIKYTDLKDYIGNSFGLNGSVKGVKTELSEVDENGVGKIKVSGETVLTSDREYIGSDLGYIDEKGLHVVGRAQYSSVGFYNYLSDDDILAENERVKKGFSLFYADKKYFCYEGRLTKKREDVVYLKFKKLPMDAKHKTKLDYKKTVIMIDNAEKKK